MIKVADTAPGYGERGWRAVKGPHPENKSGFSACGHRVLLKADPVETKTAGGIILQQKTVDAELNLSVWATVIEIGHDCWSDKSTDFCQVGDRVLVGQYAGKFHTSPVDGETYRFVSDLDVISVLRKVAVAETETAN